MAAYMDLARLSGVAPSAITSPPKLATPSAAAGSLAASSTTAKPAAAARKPVAGNKPSASMAALKKTISGSVTKPIQRKSLDPKLIAATSASASKSPFFGAK